MINLFDLKIDTQLFDKFIFHNGRPECMNVKLFNDLINYKEHIDLMMVKYIFGMFVMTMGYLILYIIMI